MRRTIIRGCRVALLLAMGGCANGAGVSAHFGLRAPGVDWAKVEDPLPKAQACWASADPTALPARIKLCGFAPFLEAMGEEPLSQRNADRAYRFLWLRTWARPVMVHIERTRGGVALEAKETDGSSESVPGTLSETTLRALPPGTWERLERAMDRSGFWTIDPAARDVNREDLVVADGACWIVQGVRAREERTVALHTEHVLRGNSSEENAALRDAALWMLELAGVELDRLGEVD